MALAEEDARSMLISAERLKHYRDHFDGQREAQAWAMQCVFKSEALSNSSKQGSTSSAHETDFLPCVAMEVVKGRRILKWTHAFSYFMKGRKSECELFAFHQVRLQDTLELLSDLTENTDWESLLQTSSSSQDELLQKRSEALSLCHVLQEAFGALDTWMSGLETDAR